MVDKTNRTKSRTGTTRPSPSSSTQRPRTNSSNQTRRTTTNYSSRNTPNSSKKSPKEPKKKKKRSLFWRIIKFQLLILLIAFLAVLGLFYAKYGKGMFAMAREAKELVQQSSKETFKATETSLVYDKDGKLIKTIKGDKEVYYLDYKDIPREFVDAMVSIEDKKFYEHKGIDVKANIRAAVGVLFHKSYGGGSTITQQLSRNVFLTTMFSYERKFKEIFISLELEKKYTKDELMEFYLNNIYFANGYYGIQAASKGYFHKDVKKLSLSQIATLCAIPNSPTMYNPREHLENTLVRRNRILENMLEDGKITQIEYQKAISEKIVIKNSKTTIHNYVETFIYDSATKALMKQEGFKFRYRFKTKEERETYMEGYNEVYEQCQKRLKTAGYRIYTSIDMEKQKLLQDTVNNCLQDFTEKNEDGVYTLQSGAVCIDNETGRVVAIVGGREQEDISGYTLNRGFQAYRQPGSTIKPILVYIPAFEKLGYNPDSILSDEKIEGGPRNAGDSYWGSISLRQAVERSKNVPVWKLYEELTPEVGMNYLKEMRFSKLMPEDYHNMATCLGGFNIGVSVLEMASAYATIENDGVYRDPTCIVKILNSEGETIIRDRIDTKLVYSGNAARMMTNVLEGVLRSGGTAANIGGIYNMDSAGKTGTTNEDKDGWFCGYTPYYTTAVWVGYDQPRTVSSLWGLSNPARIWKQYMSELHEGLPRKDFPSYVSTGSKNMVEPDYNSDTSSHYNNTNHQTSTTEKDEEEEVEETTEATEMPEVEISTTEAPTTEALPEIEEPEIEEPEVEVPEVEEPSPEVPTMETPAPEPEPLPETEESITQPVSDGTNGN